MNIKGGGFNNGGGGGGFNSGGGGALMPYRCLCSLSDCKLVYRLIIVRLAWQSPCKIVIQMSFFQSGTVMPSKTTKGTISTNRSKVTENRFPGNQQLTLTGASSFHLASLLKSPTLKYSDHRPVFRSFAGREGANGHLQCQA